MLEDHLEDEIVMRNPEKLKTTNITILAPEDILNERVSLQSLVLKFILIFACQPNLLLMSKASRGLYDDKGKKPETIVMSLSKPIPREFDLKLEHTSLEEKALVDQIRLLG